MSRPNPCRTRASRALAVALTAALMTFAVMQAAGWLTDLAAAVHLSA